LSSVEMGHAPNRTSPISIAPWEINAAAALFYPNWEMKLGCNSAEAESWRFRVSSCL
jgi:hypothetical protein